VKPAVQSANAPYKASEGREHQSGEAMVSMKTILVPTEKSDLMSATLETALLFAKRFDSYIEGFALRAAISDFVAADLIVADAWAVAETRDAELAKEARTVFENFMTSRSVPQHTGAVASLSYGWTESDAARDAFVGSYGRVFDIIVFGRPGSYPAGSSMAAVEAALFESGRPILIAPPTPPTQLGENIVIAWNRSTETARVTAFAMPLLHRAKKVTVLTVTGGMVPGPEGTELARYLQRNGIAAQALSVESGNRSSGEMMLQKAAELGCDLLIKGAYTQSRLRQMIFGGATSHILAKTTLPVFMAH
jgi:nucleotide-binding universal stress UspA family protein